MAPLHQVKSPKEPKGRGEGREMRRKEEGDLYSQTKKKKPKMRKSR